MENEAIRKRSLSHCHVWVKSNLSVKCGKKTRFNHMYLCYKAHTIQKAHFKTVLPQTFTNIIKKYFTEYKRRGLFIDNIIIHNHQTPTTNKLIEQIRREKEKRLHPIHMRLSACDRWIRQNCTPMRGINTGCSTFYESFLRSVPPFMYLDIAKVRVYPTLKYML